ncbi:hypothetical protein SAMN04489732_12480 [Amycolatopsis saalfeldensis]|uniref:Nitroreductase family protein n=2 Tax=Amycolatopsis saalfeldensis TaxID=394193 RepID=A0A1H8YLS5_9PSEU|nr:hypothetical protein SAMN04489732_12480 [Amycolatopsis saalfeldensis]
MRRIDQDDLGQAMYAMLLGVGYPADRPLRPVTQPDRRPFDEVVHRGSR